MLFIDRKVNEVILLGLNVIIKVDEVTPDYVVFRSIASGGEEVFPEDLLVKHFREEITYNDFLFEKRVPNKKITLKRNESLLMGKDGCMRVLRINEDSVMLGLDFPPSIKILKQENLKNRPHDQIRNRS